MHLTELFLGQMKSFKSSKKMLVVSVSLGSDQISVRDLQTALPLSQSQPEDQQKISNYFVAKSIPVNGDSLGP